MNAYSTWTFQKTICVNMDRKFSRCILEHLTSRYPCMLVLHMSFCTISNCLRHNPPAIWAHMDPVLRCIKETCPLIDTVHFVSDGPTSQYRSRKNFYLFSTRSFVTYNLKSATWNFTEASHDKSAADGVGASIKRADLTT